MNINPSCLADPNNLQSNFVVGAATASPSYADSYRNGLQSCRAPVPTKLAIDFTPSLKEVVFVVTHFVPVQRCNNDGCIIIEVPVQQAVHRSVFTATPGPYNAILTDAIEGDNTYISAIGVDVNSNATNAFILASNNDNCAWYSLNDLHSNQTMVLGMDKTDNIDEIIAVGATYKESFVASLYQGPFNGEGSWTYLNIANDDIKYDSWATKIMKEVLIGSYTTSAQVVKSFIYDTQNDQYYWLNYPGSVSTIAGDIWSNGRPYYIIVGGYINKKVTKTDDLDELGEEVNSGSAFMVRWNSDTGQFSNWRTFYLDNYKSLGVLTAFTGINAGNYGEYYLVAENFNQLTQSPNNSPYITSYLRGIVSNSLDYDGYISNSVVVVPISAMNDFGSASWIDYGIIQADSDQHLESSAMGMVGNNIFGAYNGSGYMVNFNSCLEIC